MSHCTTFKFSYSDEGLAVASFRRLGLTPTTGVVSEYGSGIAKALSAVGYMGRRQMRAIVSSSKGYSYFFCKVGDEYRLFLERHSILTEQDRAEMARMDGEFRRTYIKIAVERLAATIEESGTPTEIDESVDTIVLKFGAGLDRSISLRLTQNGELEEEVAGVSGTSCLDLTQQLEALLSLETADLKTTWRPEYHQLIEDEVVQVLRLGA